MSTQDGAERHGAEAPPPPRGPLAAVAADALAGLDGRPPAEHVAVYDALHARLAEALAATTAEPGQTAARGGAAVPRPGGPVPRAPVRGA